MNALIALIVVLGLGLALLVARFIRARVRRRRHDPIEFYLGWGGYSHPIALQTKVTKEIAEAVAAKGGAYLIGYFDSNGRLMRAVKMLRGSVFFDFEYAYYPNGTRKSAKVTNAKGAVTIREYDRWGRGRPGNPSFW